MRNFLRTINQLSAALTAFLGIVSLANAQQGTGETPFVGTTPLPVGRAMHGSAVLGDNLYVFGGNVDGGLPAQLMNEGGFTSSVMRTSILPNGQTGPWKNDRTLPQIRAYITNSTVSLNDVVYVVGGTDGLEDLGQQGTKYKTALISRIGADGNLTPWVESIPFPGPGISCFTAVGTPGFIHVIGGRTDALEPTANVITGVLAADGTISGWEPGPPLPQPLWFHQSAVAFGKVFTWGGLTSNDSSSGDGSVYSSTILGSGRLGPWQKDARSLPANVFAGANAVAGPFLMTFAGNFQGAASSSDVLFTYATPNALSAWSIFPANLPMRRYTACAPDYRRGTIFLSGGRPSVEEVNHTKSVIYFRLTGQAKATIQTLNTKDEVAVSQEISSVKVGEATQSAYSAQTELAKGALPGFLPYEDARRQLTGAGGRPLVAYFHMEGSGPSEAQKRKLAADAGLSTLQSKAIFTWVDVKSNPQLAQQFGIFRAPTWILYDSTGRELGRTAKALGSAEIQAGIASVRQ
jgi:hypothetical protein